jgi:hypothetical protein
MWRRRFTLTGVAKRTGPYHGNLVTRAKGLLSFGNPATAIDPERRNCGAHNRGRSAGLDPLGIRQF